MARGAVKTAMTAADFEPGGLEDWVEETPIKRWLDPQEVETSNPLLASGKAEAACEGEIIKLMAAGVWSKELKCLNGRNTGRFICIV